MRVRIFGPAGYTRGYSLLESAVRQVRRRGHGEPSALRCARDPNPGRVRRKRAAHPRHEIWSEERDVDRVDEGAAQAEDHGVPLLDALRKCE